MINAERLISRRSRPVTYLQQTAGGWDSATGEYIEPTQTEVSQTAAVFSLSAEDLVNTEGGQFSADDRKVYTVEVWEVGSKVLIGGLVYLVQSVLKDYQLIAGFNVYHLRRQGVSA